MKIELELTKDELVLFKDFIDTFAWNEYPWNIEKHNYSYLLQKVIDEQLKKYNLE